MQDRGAVGLHAAMHNMDPRPTPDKGAALRQNDNRQLWHFCNRR